jgi:hypothetical protein
VTVDAPRPRPRSESRPADKIATGSKPAFSQNVLSSIAVVASSRQLVEADDLALELAEPGELGALAVVDDRLLGELVVLHRGDRVEVRGKCGIDADRCERADRADSGEKQEEDDPEPAGRRGPRGTVTRSLAGHALRR